MHSSLILSPLFSFLVLVITERDEDASPAAVSHALGSRETEGTKSGAKG